jgi:hypothetical protein
MDASSVEYIVKRKIEGKVLLQKIVFILGYAIAFAALCTVIISFAAPLLHLPFILLACAFIAMAIFVSWRFTCVEYEIAVSGGEFSLSVIYGKSTRRRLCSTPINAILQIGEYDDAAYGRLSSVSLQKNYICMSSLSAPSVYYALFDEGQDRCVAYFDADERIVKVLKQQNPSAFRAAAQNTQKGK